MSLQGSIEDLGVAELLYVVGVSRRSGLLRLEGPRSRYEILFREGAVIAARQGREAGSLKQLLVQRQLADATHLAVLERQASREGRPLLELLEAEGVIEAGALEDLLRSEVQRVLESALDLGEGTFDFELLKDDRRGAGEGFGSLRLTEGVLPGRIPAVAERSRAGLSSGLSLPKTGSGRRAELLVDDSSISLPALPAAELRPSGGREEDDDRPLALVSLGWPALGRELQPALEAAGLSVVRPRTPAEVAERVLAAGRSGRPVSVVADVSLSAAPGLELIARAKLAARSARTLLVLDGRSTPAQLAAHRERALGLGVTHVVVPSAADEEEDRAQAVAQELLELLLAPPPRDEEAEPEPVHALPAEAGGLPDWLQGDREEPNRLSELPMQAQQARLATRLRELASLRMAAELAARLLQVALEYAPRAALFLPRGDFVRAFGAGARSVGAHRLLAARLPELLLPPDDADLPCACLRDGKSRRVPGALAGAQLLAALGEPRPAELAGLPLQVKGRSFAVLTLDDHGEERLPELAALQEFAAGLAPILSEALQRDAGRAEVRRLRAAAGR